MEDIIYINFIGINYEILFNFLINKIYIVFRNLNDVILSNNEYFILYDIDKTTNIKKYFIRIEKEIIDKIVESNINIYLPKYHYFKYDYFRNEQTKSIIIYTNNNYIPLIYLGLPNIQQEKFFEINYKFIKIGSTNYIDCSGNCNLDCSGNYDGINNYQTTLFNNYFGNDNYYLNTLEIPGDIYEICIPNNNGIIGYDSFNIKQNTFKLFKIKNNMDININTKIYFYDDISGNLLSYIIYLNTYNFLPIKNIPQEYNNIIIGINYELNNIDTSGSIYSSILSLNMQTFNPNKLCNTSNDTSGNYYYNVLFFFNYVNPNYIVESINIFSYDHDKYFSYTQIIPELYNIGSYQNNLYDVIILTDTNLSNPSILNIDKPYLFMNLDLINLGDKLIDVEFTNNYFYKITMSNKINLDILRNYLVNFTIKKYNIFKITNERFVKTNNNKLKTNIVKNHIYLDEFNHNILYDFKDPSETINFNNNIVNCIRCKIIFYYNSNTDVKISGVYSFDTKLFLNNYNLELYHKDYDFENDVENEKKKKLINMLLFLQTTTYKISIYFYNKKNSVVPAYYLFNHVDLIKINNNFNTQIDIDTFNNKYNNSYLQYGIQINVEYYILFLYADKSSFLNLPNFDELTFVYNTLMFKILKINEPNGNIKENKILFYISFQNLKELNIFMDFIKTGILNINSNIPLTNYFNIPITKIFYNYYDLNYYWILDELTGNKYQITFSINNLYVSQIYLYGDLFIQTI
jgi:hypothetical protein